ncbi:MAG: tetratricopeptide repeat protein, partial [Desulfobacteraceae bacterium]
GQELITVQTTDPRLGIPAFYSMVPGTAFRERAANSSIAMFAARHIHENRPGKEAGEELARMDKALPGRYCIKFYRGMCSLEAGNAREALNFFETAMTLDPADQDIPSICSYTGVCLKELGEYEKALSILEKGIARDPDREDIHNLMGFCHFMLKHHERSIACFEKVLALNPASAIDHASIASNHRELGSRAEAIKYYEMALALDPELEFARKNLQRLTNLN